MTKTLILMLISSPVWGQLASPVPAVTALPGGGTCAAVGFPNVVLLTTGTPGLYVCIAGSWVFAGAGGGGGVSSVSFTGGLISVANPTTAPALTVLGTTGGIPYFSTTSTWASTGTLALGLPLVGGGAGGAPTAGTRTGNTTLFASVAGTLTVNHGLKVDASGNLIDSGALVSGFGSLGDFFTTGNGSSTVFTPGWTFSGSLMMVFQGGIKQKVGDDFTLMGNTIVFAAAPPNGITIEVIQ